MRPEPLAPSPPSFPPLLVRPAVAEVGRLRLTAAALLFPASLWLLLGVEGTLAKSVGLMGLLAAVGWLSVALRSRRRPPPCLLLAQRGLFVLPCPPAAAPLRTPDGPPTVPWSRIEAVEVDEEALCVLVHRCDGEPLRLQPPWHGVGLHELAEQLRARVAASGVTHG